MTAGESAKAEPTLKEVIEGLKIHLEVAHEYYTPSGSMDKGCDHEGEIKRAIAALEAFPSAVERTALENIREIALRDMDKAEEKAKERESTASYFYGMAAEAAMLSIAIKLRINAASASEGTKSE